MAVIFLTAIPMSIASSNVFLFLIAIFSFYLAYAGMRFAIKETEQVQQIFLIGLLLV